MLNPIPWSKSIILKSRGKPFYGTEYEICVVFGPVGSTETFELGRKACYFWGHFAYILMGKKHKHSSIVGWFTTDTSQRKRLMYNDFDSNFFLSSLVNS